MCCDHDDYQKLFKESEMNKLIDSHVNSILLLITIPPPPQRRPGQNPYCHTLILPFCHTLIPPFPHVLILSFCHAGDGVSQAEKEEDGRKEEEDGRKEEEGDRKEEEDDRNEGEGQAGEGGEGQGGEGTSVDEPEPQGTAAEGADEGARGPEEKPPTGKVVKEEEEEEEEVRSKLDGEVDLTKERPLQRSEFGTPDVLPHSLPTLTFHPHPPQPLSSASTDAALYRS